MFRLPYSISCLSDGTYQLHFRTLGQHTFMQASTLGRAFDHANHDLPRLLQLIIQEQSLDRIRQIFARPLPGEAAYPFRMSLSLKIALLLACKERQFHNSDLAQRMNLRPSEAHRLLRLSHKTKIDTLIRAFHVLGIRVEFSLIDRTKNDATS